jgi:hypothetical protein
MHDRDTAPCNSWCGPTCAKSTRHGTVRSIGLICRAVSSFLRFLRRLPTVLTGEEVCLTAWGSHSSRSTGLLSVRPMMRGCGSYPREDNRAMVSG